MIRTLSLLILVSACGGPTTPRESSSTGDERPASGPRTDTSAPSAPPADARSAPSDPQPLEVLEGRASYYSDTLSGRSTASGEPYDPTAFTAASRDLPFGTRLRVHRIDESGASLASVEVRVNDRGPFRDHSRILDLSRAAAEALGMIRAGVVRIRVEVLSRPE